MTEIRKEMVEKQQKLFDQVTITVPPGTAMEMNVSLANSPVPEPEPEPEPEPVPELETYPVTQRRSIDNDSKRVSFHKEEVTNSLVEGYEQRSSILKRSSIEDGINIKEVLKGASLFLDSSIEEVPKLILSEKIVDNCEGTAEDGLEDDEEHEPEEVDEFVNYDGSESNFENYNVVNVFFQTFSIIGNNLFSRMRKLTNWILQTIKSNQIQNHQYLLKIIKC